MRRGVGLCLDWWGEGRDEVSVWLGLTRERDGGRETEKEGGGGRENRGDGGDSGQHDLPYHEQGQPQLRDLETEVELLVDGLRAR